MCRYVNAILMVALGLFPMMPRETARGTEMAGNGMVTMAMTRLEATDRTLAVHCEIRNDSVHDIWVLMGIGESDASATAFLDSDGRTLRLRSRFGAPRLLHGNAIYGRYVRLCAGARHVEALRIPLPIPLMAEFISEREQGAPSYADRVAVEIGYYAGDLPGMIGDILESAERPNDERNSCAISRYFGGRLGFEKLNEGLRARNEEVMVPYTDQVLREERYVHATAENVRIPFVEEDLSERHAPDLASCTRVEIRYEPSTLAYFFPYESQQRLMSSEEIEYLRCERTIVVTDAQHLKSLSDSIGQGGLSDGLVRELSVAHLRCYCPGVRLTSLSVYNDESILSEDGYRFTYRRGLQSLATVTPRIQELKLRVQCASNLVNLWYRLRLYQRADRASSPTTQVRKETLLPPATVWCDAMLKAYRKTGMSDDRILKEHCCPSPNSGRCHYAMNPHCRPDSPADTVLLFETKAGWNQHGGPELFTFDNHDPKGGCVLLNDGTVKFIRTEEELHALRWR